MPEVTLKQRITQAQSPYNRFCHGAFSSHCPYYFLGVNLAIATVKRRFSHQGTSQLDAIHAFDKAEVSTAYLGQINLIQVSSFCGPMGLIWGYDVCQATSQPTPFDIQGQDCGVAALHIADINPLNDAYTRLVGTVAQQRFPFMPGAHVPCAAKWLTQVGPCQLYVAHSIAIAENRARDACLLMEDVGTLPEKITDSMGYLRNLLINLINATLAIGRTQGVHYQAVLLGIKTIQVAPDEMGCALVASPYFTLAQRALPKHCDLSQLTIDQWESLASNQFLCKNAC